MDFSVILNSLNGSMGLDDASPFVLTQSVRCSKESARVLFVKTPDNDIVLLHGFIKKTQKTPNKDAKIAMENLERLKNNIEVTPLPLTKYSF